MDMKDVYAISSVHEEWRGRFLLFLDEKENIKCMDTKLSFPQKYSPGAQLYAFNSFQSRHSAFSTIFHAVISHIKRVCRMYMGRRVRAI